MRLSLSIGFLLCALVVPARAQWHWAHPQPQGHTLHDVVFLDDNTAIAVGDVGTIMVTHDGGNTWSVSWKVDGVTSDLNSIDHVDANTAVAVGDNSVILVSPNQGANWLLIPPPVNGGDLFDVSFTDATHGVAVGGGSGGGFTLTTVSGPFVWHWSSTSATLRNVDMVSTTEAFAASSGLMQHSLDGGETWSDMPGVFGDVVDFRDPLHGAIALRNGGSSTPPRCYVTADGGATWTPSDLHFGLTTEDYLPGEILFVDESTIMLASTVQCCTLSAFDPPATGEVAVSTNTGATFTNTSNGRPMLGLAHNSAGVTIIVGQNGRMLRRSAIGAITNIGGPSPTQGYDLGDYGGSSSFFGSQVGVVINNDGYSYQQGGSATYFAVTHDGGQTWTHATGSGQCSDVLCLSTTEMIAVGQGVGPIGAVLRSTDGGTSWSNIWGQSSPSNLAAIAASSPTHAVAVGYSSQALVIDHGAVSVVSIGGTSFTDIAFASPSVAVAVGFPDQRSTDGGLTWSSTVGPSTNVRALAFISPTTAFGVAPAGIVRTDDVANTWTPIASGAAIGLYDIGFSDSNHGMAVGSDILVTSNGGITWSAIEKPTTYPLNHVTMISSDLAFVSGTQSILFQYGEAPVPTLIRALDIAAIPFGAELHWEVIPDNNLSSFSITRSSGATRETIASNLAVTSRSFRDEGLTPGKTYEYQLVAVDRDGSYNQSMPVKVTVPNASAELLPNQPNPFNPETTIRFVVPEKMRVTISVHDVAGRVVATLVDDVREPGVNSITWNAQGLASGVYFAKLRAGKTEISRKMVLLK